MGRIILRMLACVWLALVALRPVVHAQQPPHAARGQSRETSGTLRGPSLDLAYIEWSGEGTPIVLLHGLGGNALSWAGVAESLAGRHVIAPDLPGHGESPAVGDWSLEPLASAVERLVQLHSTDVLILPADGSVLRGHDAIRTMFPSYFPALRATVVDIDVEETWLAGDSLLHVATYQHGGNASGIPHGAVFGRS